MGSKLRMENSRMFYAPVSQLSGDEVQTYSVTVEAENLMITEEDRILDAIREVCSGLALSDRARAARYDKIVEILKEKNDG